MTERMNVPKLRFGEFKTEWTSHYLSDLCSKLNVGFVGTCEKYYTSSDDGVMLVRTGDLKGGKADLTNTKFVTYDFHKANKKSQIIKGDLLIARHGSNGQASLYDSDLEANTLNIVVLRANSDTDNYFLLNNINSSGVRKQTLAVTAGSTQGVINTKEIAKLNVSAPYISEQQKIASFLSKVDEKITLLTEKKAKLIEYKKGVMQQLFSGKWEEQDGQLTFVPPTMRFKADDGDSFPDWEEYKNPINIVAGNAYKLDEYNDTGLLLIQGQNIFPDEIILDKTPKYIKNEGANHTKITLGDIVLGLNRPITNGKLKTCRFMLTDESVLYQRAGKLEFNCDELDTEFLYQYLSSRIFMKQLNLELVGSDQPYIKSNLFDVTKHVFPTIAEQKKISSFLNVLDYKLNLLSSELNKAKEWKKGLLQQMFV